MLTLVDSLGLAGGGERLARLITVRLDRERFERSLCVSRWSADWHRDPAAAGVLEELRDAGVRFLGIQRDSPVALRPWRPLLTILREETDVLHGHKLGSNVWAAVLGTLARTPVVIAHEHSWSFEGQPLRRLLDRKLIARRSDAFIAVSREDRRRMIEVEGIKPADVLLVPNGIPAPPPPSGRDVRAELGIEPSDPVIGTVCTLRPQKALAVLVEAAAILRRDLPRLRVLIVGEGEDRQRLEALVEDRRLGDSVWLLGQRSDVPDLLDALDVAVCSSDFEGSPLSILEYMAASSLVVSTRVGGVPDLIEDGVQGLLVAPGDPEALAAAVAELLHDPRRAAEMGRSGRERQRLEFDLDVTVSHLAELYEELYAASPRADPARLGDGGGR